jgi:hypothetical protein
VTLQTGIDLVYLLAAIGFILALKGLSSPKHARNGNLLAAAGGAGGGGGAPENTPSAPRRTPRWRSGSPSPTPRSVRTR